MYVDHYMKLTLTDLYKRTLTLPEEKAHKICAKAEQLLDDKNMTFTKFVTIVEEMIEEQK